MAAEVAVARRLRFVGDIGVERNSDVSSHTPPAFTLWESFMHSPRRLISIWVLKGDLTPQKQTFPSSRASRFAFNLVRSLWRGWRHCLSVVAPALVPSAGGESPVYPWRGPNSKYARLFQ